MVLKRLITRSIVTLPLLLVVLVIAAACAAATPETIIVEKEVIKEVEKQVIVEKEVIKEIEKEEMRDSIPDFAPGDTVRVLYLVREGTKERIQAFEGVCIGRKGGGLDETFTVRKISGGIAVERIFPLYSPMIDSIERVKKGRVRRAKLYYLRERRGKAARIKEIRYAKKIG